MIIAPAADVRLEFPCRGRLPNVELRRARLRLPSPVVPGRRMSRQELAEGVNAHVHATYGRLIELDAGYIGKLERGEHRWPRADYRHGLRAVLRVAGDAEIGLYNMRRNPSDEAFLATDPVLGSFVAGT